VSLSKSVKSLPVVAVAIVVAGIVVLGIKPETRADLIPLVAARTLISDRMFGGGSEVGLLPATQGIRFRYALSDEVSHPWAGINLGFTDSATAPIDLGDWERIEILARSTPARAVRVQILSDDTIAGSVLRDSIHAIYHTLEYTPDGTRVGFPWAAFTIPSWWRAQRGRSESQRLDLLDRFRSIEFHSGDSPDGRDSSVVEILEIQLVGPNRIFRALGWCLLLLGGAGGAWSFLRRRPNSQVGSQSGSFSSLVPDPVTLNDPRNLQREQLVASLREKFNDPELSLDSFALAQGMSPRLVATLIKEGTQLHFKGALNELRLTEAARLLKESKANVSEIAYAVGFQNPSHFGRAFREKYGVSPTDFRTGGKVPDPGDETPQNGREPSA
jgi:AraC-like DNA-binding protein